ncbi:Outer membrane protein assembly factor BamB [subsurface metagenome]
MFLVIEEKIGEIDKKVASIEEKEKEVEIKKEKNIDVEEDVQEIKKMKEDLLELKEDVIKAAEEKPVMIEEIFEKPAPVSKTIEEELKEIRKMKPLKIKMAVKGAPSPETVEEKEEVLVYTKFTIKLKPKDAIIIVNEEKMGKAKYSGLYIPGTRLLIKSEKEGYETVEKEVEVLDQKAHEIIIELREKPKPEKNEALPEKQEALKEEIKEPATIEPQPVTWKQKVSSAPFVREVVVSGDSIFAADENGSVYCYSTSGKKQWSVSTRNIPNDNSMPVFIDNRIFFSGPKELVVIDIKTGEVIKTIPLGKGEFSSHLFGRRVLQFKDNIVYPSDEALIILDKNTLKAHKRIEIPDGSNSSPASYYDKVLVVNLEGSLLIINPESEMIESVFETEAMQPVGIAPTINEDLAAFAGRKGTVVLFDLKANEIIWQKRIGTGRIPGIFQDVEMGKNGMYPYTGKTFYALSLINGNELFDSVTSTCAPLYREEVLYYGTGDAKIIAMDALTGDILKSYYLDSNITVQPASYKDNIVVATESGTIYSLNPEYMK